MTLRGAGVGVMAIALCAATACTGVTDTMSQPPTLIPDQTTTTTLDLTDMTPPDTALPAAPDTLPNTANPIADPDVFTPDRALVAMDLGGVGTPNATAGSYLNTNTFLINPSRFDIEVVDMRFESPLEGTIAGYQIYWYRYRGDGGNYELVWGAPLTGPLPAYVNRFDGTPLEVLPVAPTSWPFTQNDPHAIWIVAVIDYDGNDKLVLGPFTVTYRIRGTTTTYTTSISQGGLVLCPPGYTDPCVP